MHQERIKNLAAKIKEVGLDYYLISTHCEYDVEYLPDYARYLEWLTGFSGSNGILLLGAHEELIFFTDGRYLTQAHQELEILGFNLQIYNISQLKEKIPANVKIGYDPKLYSYSFLEAFKLKENMDRCPITSLTMMEDSSPARLIVYEACNKVIHNDEKNKQTSFIYSQEFTCLSYQDKINQVCSKLENNIYFFNNPANLCWILNIRGQDIDYNLVFLCYGLLYKDTQKLQIFCAKPDKLRINYDQVEILDLNALENILENISDKIGANKTISIYHQDLMKDKFSEEEDPCFLLRSIKNGLEIENAFKIHILDGVALIKFWYWLEHNLPTDEIKAAEKLLEFRKTFPEFFSESFGTISGFNENGAIIHYHASERTNKIIEGSGLYLLDSGGHYWGGTTDITRVFAIGEPTKEQKYHYSLVLKSHLKLLMGKFPKNIPLHQLNSLSREVLWNEGLDCPHSIGHGVSNFLEVHEGPYSINSRCNLPLVENIIISNEPGLYFEGKYGIRIENLMHSINEDEWIKFKNLTMVPYDWNLIDHKIMTDQEIDFIKNYHNDILDKLGNYLSNNEKNWLIGKIYA